MPVSIWEATAMCTIDGADSDANFANGFDLGFAYLGGTKAFRRRVLIGFDLRHQPVEGRGVVPIDAITAAELRLTATLIAGRSGWSAKVARVARADWDYLTATWDMYRAASPWTSPGGDVASPPDGVAWSSPAALGVFAIGGLAAHAVDALTHRDGLLLVRLKADVEADAGFVTTYISGGDLFGPETPRLAVTYDAAQPSPVDRPAGGSTDVARPEPAATPARPSRPDTP